MSIIKDMFSDIPADVLGNLNQNNNQNKNKDNTSHKFTCMKCNSICFFDISPGMGLINKIFTKRRFSKGCSHVYISSNNIDD